MGTVIPKNLQDKIIFCENHLDLWNTNATAIGTTTTAVSALTTLTTAARDAFNAQVLVQDNAKSATIALNAAVDAMASATADIVKAIKTKAATTGDSVYTLANIPVPATPSPRPAPGKVTDFNATIGALGELNLTWKGDNQGAAGTVYQVWRTVGDSTTSEYLGGVGTKKFVDATIPAGTSKIMYQIQAVRSSAVGQFATFNILFGTNANGQTVESITQIESQKKAA